jgi:hypothetical protein
MSRQRPEQVEHIKPPAMLADHLPRLPPSMRLLTVNHQGYPVPWFAYSPEKLTVIDKHKKRRAIEERRCWICGGALSRRLSFVLGPAQTITRTTTEPPSHRACAEFAVIACPFLRNPQRRRSSEPDDPAVHALHNPGCFAVWTTDSYETDSYELDAACRVIVGEPMAVAWFHRGKPASRRQVLQAIGIYRLQFREEDAMRVDALMRWLPVPERRTK